MLRSLMLLLSLWGALIIPSWARTEPTLELVESFPIETNLDHPAIPDAGDVWLEMIQGAERSLAFAEFYASDSPGSRLEDVIGAIEAAADRGVDVRFLAEKNFYKTYPEILDRFAGRTGIEVRILDTAATMGGVLHAKYFIVDGETAFLGSQNFDWRALTHIQELGVRFHNAELVNGLASVFNLDWRIAGGITDPPDSVSQPPAAYDRAELVRPRHPGSIPVSIVQEGDSLEVSLVASPKGWLPRGVSWDLPLILNLIDNAQSTVRVQLLTYGTVGRDRTYFGELESALRRAAARGVAVQLILSHWSRRKGTIDGLQSLQALPHITVKLMTIPEWSGGFIPFARVVHAKYLVVDGRAVWVGTGNWEKDYFYRSRNVGLIIEGESIGRRLDQIFMDNWNGDYVQEVDPCAVYEAPKISGEEGR
ncbi:MAG: hypothetical protein KJ970_17825 [Candidatus Eisenbacteria bacterium]|uniref:PLD phosphodiesterase domain-containing protein n=1 Tax=Eiseniibacteriota bacterium TaxID=2212470 RepID=A0A948RXC9_UNCEI|nr:hypothetical protein [Candidatus Eisenbacteria bacterium]